MGTSFAQLTQGIYTKKSDEFVSFFPSAGHENLSAFFILVQT